MEGGRKGESMVKGQSYGGANHQYYLSISVPFEPARAPLSEEPAYRLEGPKEQVRPVPCPTL